MTLPAVYTPQQVASHLGWTERFVRNEAVRLGACRGSGQRMRLLDEDVKKILEANKCPSTSSSVAASGISTTLLARLAGVSTSVSQPKQPTKRRPRGTLPKSKEKSGTVISMARPQS
jgi:hypothetical protein